MCFKATRCVGSFKISSYCSHGDMLCTRSFVFCLFCCVFETKINFIEFQNNIEALLANFLHAFTGSIQNTSSHLGADIGVHR